MSRGLIIYKGVKAHYLGFKRWRIFMPDGFTFDIMAKAGIWELIYCIERGRDRGWV